MLLAAKNLSDQIDGLHFRINTFQSDFSKMQLTLITFHTPINLLISQRFLFYFLTPTLSRSNSPFRINELEFRSDFSKCFEHFVFFFNTSGSMDQSICIPVDFPKCCSDHFPDPITFHILCSSSAGWSLSRSSLSPLACPFHPNFRFHEKCFTEEVVAGEGVICFYLLLPIIPPPSFFFLLLLPSLNFPTFLLPIPPNLNFLLLWNPKRISPNNAPSSSSSAPILVRAILHANWAWKCQDNSANFAKIAQSAAETGPIDTDQPAGRNAGRPRDAQGRLGRVVREIFIEWRV